VSSRTIVVCFLAIAFAAKVSAAEDKEFSIPQLPDGLRPGESEALLQSRAELVQERDALNIRIQRFKGECKDVPEDQWSKCEDEQTHIRTAKQVLAMKIHWFGERLENASRRSRVAVAPGYAVPSLPLNGRLVNNESERNAYNYARVINQFEVETSRRTRYVSSCSYSQHDRNGWGDSNLEPPAAFQHTRFQACKSTNLSTHYTVDRVYIKSASGGTSGRTQPGGVFYS